MMDRELHPVQAEVAFWHNRELRVVAQVRKQSPWDGVSTYIHVLSPGDEIALVHSFHTSGKKHDKFLEKDGSRLDLRREKEPGMPHVWDGERWPGGSNQWLLTGLRWDVIEQLPQPTARPELVFESQPSVGVELGFYPQPVNARRIPFPSRAMSTGMIHQVQPPVIAFAHFGEDHDWLDAVAWRFDGPAYDDPPKEAHMLMHGSVDHWRGVCCPDPERG